MTVVSVVPAPVADTTSTAAPAASIAPADALASAPPTFQAALRIFGRQVRAMKKQPTLAGQIERELAAKSKDLLREAAQETLQAQADGHSPHCPRCGARLQNVESRSRTIQTQWGAVTITRAYGKCPRCKEWHAPADNALGLEASTKSSPDLAEKMTWLCTQMPAAQAAEVFEHLTGQPVSPSTIERQTRRKGEQALREQKEDVRQALSTDERGDFSRRHRPSDEPSTFDLVIVIDGWMIRERDDWGRTNALREAGQSPQRWHEVKAARLFRLDQCARTQGQRGMLLASHRVATRGGPEALSERVWTEAMRMGLLRAREVLIIADGGVWIWNIARDRFPYARGTLDFYHAASHLWAVANALFGEGTDEARQWVEPLRHQLRHGEHGRVLKTLEDLTMMVAELDVCSVVARHSQYFQTHREHLDYAAKAEHGEPIGSGAIESTCKQYQQRFKRPGQFWYPQTEEYLFELDARRRNHRWNSLWPHLLSQN